MTQKISKISLAKKIVSQAKQELAEEKEKQLKERAKSFLEEIQEAKRTVALLERQMKNFIREVEIEE